MQRTNLSNVKYYPDRFYISCGELDIHNLTSFFSDFEINEEHAAFIHEFYHYLTNITTFAGIRQFNLNFCDRFSLSTILTSKNGINAYPINENILDSCKEAVNDWNGILKTLELHDIDRKVIEETDKLPSKKFKVTNIEFITIPIEEIVNGKRIRGTETAVSIESIDLPLVKSFNLTFAAIDEFLSVSIDEFLVEKELSSVDYRGLSQRPFYPYLFFDELLSYYKLFPFSAFEKILLAYFAVNSSNPPVALIKILQKLQNGGFNDFKDNPENFLKNNYVIPERYNELLYCINCFSKETLKRNYKFVSKALNYFYNKFYCSKSIKDGDLFYFIRPFFSDNNSVDYKIQFVTKLFKIFNDFTPPVFLKNNLLYSFNSEHDEIAELTTIIMATYEIFESLNKNQIAKRLDYLKKKYSFPDGDIDCDDIKKFTDPPIYGSFRIALNDLGLYELYLNMNNND